MNPEERDGMGDRRLTEIATRLRRPVEAPGLWDRIEEGLLRGQERAPSERHAGRRRRTLRRLATLAAAIPVICALVFFIQPGNPQQRPSMLLEENEAALAEKERVSMERELARLEPLFQREKAARSEQAAPLAGHLEILDVTIDSCRKAWQSNRLNRGVQRSLLRGYRKKLELLQDFISARG